MKSDETRTVEQDASELAEGYSIVEMMAALLITLFVMSGVYTLMIANQRTYEQQTQLADVQQTARVALDLMTREIRMAGSDPTLRAFDPDPGCLGGTYVLPAPSPAAMLPTDIAAITIAKKDQIRVKMDRAFFHIGEDVIPTPVPSASPLLNCNPSVTDSDYEEDDESLFGDGFLDDEGEDVMYRWDAAEQALYRTEYLDNVPAAACRPCTAPRTQPAATSTPELLIADRVVNLRFKYYSSEPQSSSCPSGTYATADDFENALDACDPPLGVTPDFEPVDDDLSRIRRVRMLLTIETQDPDQFEPQKQAGKRIGNRVTLTSEATLRNRIQY